MNLNFIYDSSVNSAPTGFTATLNAVRTFFDNTFSDPVTINISVGYGEIDGTPLSSGALGESSTSIAAYTYSQIRSALVADAKTAIDSAVVASLPTSNPTGSSYLVPLAEAKALGLPTGSGQDGAMGFAAANFDYDNSNGVSAGQFDFFGTVSHEVSEIMGRFLLAGQGGYTVEDLLHFSAPNTRTFSAGGYFSADNGVTNLGSFNTNTSGDLGDWASSVGPDAFLAFAPSGVVLPVSANDIKVMDALGWDAASDTTPPTLASISPVNNATGVLTGANLVLTFTENVRAGAGNVTIHRFSDGSATATIAIGDSSQVSFSGSTVTINPTSDLAWGTKYYITVDSGAIQDLAGNGFAGISANTAFDFTTASTTTIEADGNTTLGTASGHYYLLDNTGAGPSLKYNGADYTTGEFGSWTPIGAEKTATGYEIAWNIPGADQFTLWSTDTNGNYTGHVVGTVSGSDSAIVSAEPLFQQDLNGDGYIGNPPATVTVIEADGNTTLTTSANHYYLLDNTGAGPSLKYNGADYTTGEFGSWTPIGAEKTSTGYEIAWNIPGADQFTLWSTDTNGNYTGHVVGTVSGSDSAIVSAEPLFQQDLNGDGYIGNPPATVTVIEADGNTTLTTASGHYYLLDSTGAGPSLKYNGADYTTGEFGSWTPIGAEKTSTGYEIAWNIPGADQFTLWSTDTNGNYTGHVVGTVSGSDSAIISAETLFQQDLNGDGYIGSPTVSQTVATLSNALSEPNISTDMLVPGAGAGVETRTVSDNLLRQYMLMQQYMAGSSDEPIYGAGIVDVMDPSPEQQSWLAAHQ